MNLICLKIYQTLVKIAANKEYVREKEQTKRAQSGTVAGLSQADMTHCYTTVSKWWW